MKKIFLTALIFLGACEDRSQELVGTVIYTEVEPSEDLRIVMLENRTYKAITKIVVLSAEQNLSQGKYQLYHQRELILEPTGGQPLFFTAKGCSFIIKVTFSNNKEMETKPQDYCEKHSYVIHERDRRLSDKEAERLVFTAKV